MQFGAASVRVADGAVAALYGGVDATRHFTSNADTAGVPVGSAFKPFVLAAALEDGRIGVPARGGAGSGSRVGGGARGGRAAGHAGAAPRAGAGATREAFRRLGAAVGPDRVRDVAVAAGLLPRSLGALDASFALGTSTPSAIRMAGAYATFAGEGRRAAPYSVVSASYRGRVLEGLERPPARQALDRAAARELTRALRDVAVDSVDAGTLRTLGPVAAGRTDGRDRIPAAWFVGYGDEWSTAVTVFRTAPGGGGLLPLDGEGADAPGGTGSLPLRVWSAYMAGAPPAGDGAPAAP